MEKLNTFHQKLPERDSRALTVQCFSTGMLQAKQPKVEPQFDFCLDLGSAVGGMRTSAKSHAAKT